MLPPFKGYAIAKSPANARGERTGRVQPPTNVTGSVAVGLPHHIVGHPEVSGMPGQNAQVFQLKRFMTIFRARVRKRFLFTLLHLTAPTVTIALIGFFRLAH